MSLDKLKNATPSTGGRQRAEDGDYNFVVTKTWKQDTRNAGLMDWISFTMAQDEPYAGIEIKEGYNTKNKSETAEEIAWADIAAIFTVTGVDMDEYDGTLNALEGEMIRLRIVTEVEKNVELVDKATGRKVRRDLKKYKIINYMNLEGEDASGKKVPAFIPINRKPVDDDDDAGYKSDTGSGGTRESKPPVEDIDDEIPF